MFCKLNYCNHDLEVFRVSINVQDCYKISDSVINKALMIAMNYLLENTETEDEESAV